MKRISMSANTSQRQLQGIALGSDVTDFAIWRLVVTCRGCCICRTRVANHAMSSGRSCSAAAATGVSNGPGSSRLVGA